MDRSDLESCRGLPHGLAGMHELLAMRMAGRLEAMGMPKYLGTTRSSGGRFAWTGQVVVDDDALSIPEQWRKPKRIFVNSMSDLFQEAVPIEFIGKVWRAMETANWHTYQILTKRPERMRAILSDGTSRCCHMSGSAHPWRMATASIESISCARRRRPCASYPSSRWSAASARSIFRASLGPSWAASQDCAADP